MHAATIEFTVRRRGRLARLGDWMARHRRVILALQWFIVVFYAVLVVLPAFLPHPHPDARLFQPPPAAAAPLVQARDPIVGVVPMWEKAPHRTGWEERLWLLAQFLFWGVWWPFVIASVMLFGRFWCGVLCPEGALTEFASRHGRGGSIPRWVRWSGWPLAAFVLITIYGQMTGVYDDARAALLILGGSTVAAVAIGWMYGKGKRVWCRYLCPVSGVFGLLARVSPLHFHVDRDAWQRHPIRTPAVDCAPLLSVRQLQGMTACHACGRCSGHRNAVELRVRSPNVEILSATPPSTVEALLLVFGLFGVAIGAFQWSASPWYAQASAALAAWLEAQGILWPLGRDAPWWLLANMPGGDLSWLEGGVLVGYILAVAAVLGGIVWLGTFAAARLARIDWRTQSLALVPLAGAGLFLGLSMTTVSLLATEGALLGRVPLARDALLGGALVWSLWLGARLIVAARPGAARCALALLCWQLPATTISLAWVLVFHVW